MTAVPTTVCFVAPNNYAVLSGRADIMQIGGAEVQRVLIAKQLIQHGWRVSFVTLDHGHPDGIEHDGIRVYKMCAKTGGVPGLRFFHPRWTSLCAAMRRANADVYIQRTAGVETGQAAHWALRNNRRFVYSVANDPECDERLGGKRAWRERRLFRYGLTHAHRVVAQTQRQRDMLEQHHKINATVIRSCAPDPGNPFPTPHATGLLAASEKPGATGQLAASANVSELFHLKNSSNDPNRPVDLERFTSRRVLWVGRFAKQKRIDRLPAIAKALPDVHFDIIGDHPNPPPDTARSVADLRQLPNVTMHGYAPYAEMPAHYAAASLLLCTSDWEGFPNTFMEAWSRGIPVVSTIDPDDLIKIHELGIATGPEKLVDGIKEMQRSPNDWQATAGKCRAYYLEQHSPETTGNAWNELLLSLE